MLCFFAISSCKKEGDETPAETITSTINIQFKNEVDGAMEDFQPYWNVFSITIQDFITLLIWMVI